MNKRIANNFAANAAKLLVAVGLLLGWVLSPSVAHAAPTIVEYPVTTHILTMGVVTGPDGNIWYTQVLALGAGSVIGKMSPSGVVLAEYPTPAPTVATIAVGPDGNLWAGAAASLIRITPAGVMTEFPTDTGPIICTYISGLITGPDGNLWMGNQSGSGMCKANTNGEILASYPDTGFPSSLTIGSDGRIWYAYGGTAVVGAITTAGVNTNYPIPGGGTTDSIAAGSDGNLWVTDRFGGASAIHRVTTSGVATTFALPSPISGPRGIAPGPDGNLWFPELDISKIGSITTDGTITEYDLPSAGPALQIAPGPNNTMWFTGYTQSTIGVVQDIVPPPPTPGPTPPTTTPTTPSSVPVVPGGPPNTGASSGN